MPNRSNTRHERKMESLRCDVGGTRSAWKAGVWFWMVRCLLDVQMEMSICSVFRGARERSGWKYKFGCGWKAGFSWWVKHKKNGALQWEITPGHQFFSTFLTL